VLRVERLTKAFPQTLAVDDVSFDLRRGEVHCLLGENGAGKSTFAECLYGAYRPDSGHIFVAGRPVHFGSPRDAIRHGLGMVHQHFVLVPSLTVTENVIAGVAAPGLFLDLEAAGRQTREQCQNYDVDLEPSAVVAQLSVGQQQWVEILKALYVGARILILDEPTAVLTPQETDRLFAVLKRMTAEGLSIILITHKLDEVMAVSDRVTVFRQGKHIATLPTAQTSKAELARLMVGRDVIFRVDKEQVATGEPVLEVENLRALKDNQREALRGVTFRVHQGEIFGLAGVAGNGQKELFDILVGVGQPSAGSVRLDGRLVAGHSPQDAARLGLASIPQDRITQGLLMDHSVSENLILGLQRDRPFRAWAFMNMRQVMQFARQAITEYAIAAASPRLRIRVLSGGNLQKVILARELSRRVKCVLASSPTRGLDVGATEFVHRRLVALRQGGAGVLLISEDLDEVLNLADRVAVMFQGQIMGVFGAGEVKREQIGLLMAGVREAVE
jgi:simple sugar transport system ATP-binding protein